VLRAPCIALALVSGVLCATSQAATVTYSFRGGAMPTSWLEKDTFSQADSDGVARSTVVWGYSDSVPGLPAAPPVGQQPAKQTFASGYVRRFSTGLGACGANEVGTNPNNICPNTSASRVDNEGSDEWLLLTFGQEVAFKSIDLTQFETRDYDVSYWVGNLDLSGSNSPLAGKTFEDHIFPDFGTGTNVLSQDMDSNLRFNLQGKGNFLLIGAHQSGGGDNRDYFYLDTLTVDYTQVPAPASILLLGSGLLMLAGLRMRRLA
jgi:hypothetical protein